MILSEWQVAQLPRYIGLSSDSWYRGTFLVAETLEGTTPVLTPFHFSVVWRGERSINKGKTLEERSIDPAPGSRTSDRQSRKRADTVMASPSEEPSVQNEPIGIATNPSHSTSDMKRIRGYFKRVN